MRYLQMIRLFLLLLTVVQLKSGLSEEEEASSVFEPSSEWQVIKSGQSIPAGLHVRVNMQTGLKEAKLIDVNEPSIEGKLQVSGNPDNTDSNNGVYGHSDRRGVINKTKKLFSRKELSEMLKNLKDDGSQDSVPLLLQGTTDETDSDSVLQSENDFSSINDLKEMVTFHSDVELMLQHLQILTNSNSTSNAIIQSLIELEYYVHQIDNARDLDVLGGLAIIVRLLNHSDSNVQCAAAFTLGAAVQSNPEVQEKALSYHALENLVKIIVTSSSDILKRRTLYALGSLLRGHPLAVKQFIVENGIDRISAGIQRHSSPVIIKIMILLTDLLNFEELEGKADIKISFVLSSMHDNGWCTHVQMVLDSNDIKHLETSIFLMEKLIDVCDFSNSLALLHSLHSTLSINEDTIEATKALKYIIESVDIKKPKHEL